MEKKFRLMVIDDSMEKRRSVYETVLANEYDLVLVGEPNNLFIEIENETVDGYLVDVVLNRWIDKDTGKPQELIPVLESLEKDKSISLVSQEYSTLLIDDKLTVTINSIIEKGINVNSFFVWNDFEKTAYEIQNNQNKNQTKTIVSTIKLSILKNSKVKKVEEENGYDVGIFSALSEEIKPFNDLLQDKKDLNIGEIQYSKGFISTKAGKIIRIITSHQQEMGMVEAGIITSLLIKEFKIRHVFMIGVCGGRDGYSKIGDIVIPHEVVTYQKGKIGEDGLQKRPGFAMSKVKERMIFENRCDKIIKRIHETVIKKCYTLGKPTDIEKPNLLFDEMACGDCIINKSGMLNDIATDVSKDKLCSVDMESYSILKVSEFLPVKTMVIKSIMDISSNKNDKYKMAAIYLSAYFLFEVLKDEVYVIV